MFFFFVFVFLIQNDLHDSITDFDVVVLSLCFPLIFLDHLISVCVCVCVKSAATSKPEKKKIPCS